MSPFGRSAEADIPTKVSIPRQVSERSDDALECGEHEYVRTMTHRERELTYISSLLRVAHPCHQQSHVVLDSITPRLGAA